MSLGKCLNPLNQRLYSDLGMRQGFAFETC